MKRGNKYIAAIIIGIILTISGCFDGNPFGKGTGLFFPGSAGAASRQSVKVSPESITLIPATASAPDPQTSETATETAQNNTSDDPSRIWSLFDGNTASSYLPSEPQRFKVSFGRTIKLKKLKIFGTTTSVLNVYTGPADDPEKIHSLCVDRSALKANSWNTLIAETTVKTDSVIIEIIPDNDSAISEIEFWSDETVNLSDGSLHSNLENVKSYDDLEAAIEKCKSHVIETKALPGEISISGTQEQSVIGQVHVTLAVNPIVYKRAFIKYRAKNILAPVGIERRINNLSWNGGYDIPVKEGTTPPTDWINHFEEINPAWLVPGDNLIEFRTNKADVSIQDLSLVLVQDNGWNQIVSSSKPEAYDNDEATGGEIVGLDDSLDIDFDRTIEPESITFYLAKKTTSRLAIQFLYNGQWIPVKSDWAADLTKMAQGWNTITLPSQIVSISLRLKVDANGWSDTESKKIRIGEIRVCGSPSGDPNVRPRIIVSYPRNGEYYGRNALIQGFVNSTYPASIAVEGRAANREGQDNSFSLSLSKDDTRFSEQQDDTAWDPVSVAIRQEYSVNTTMHLTNNLLSASSNNNGTNPGGTPGGNDPGNGTGYTTEVLPDSAKTITYGSLTIDIPAGAVREKIKITIIPLAKNEVVGLNPGMINVTYPAAGYRFLVNGKPHYTFRKPINISFTYGKNLLLKSQGDNDVFMYYYDESQKIWKRLRRLNTTATKSNIVNTSLYSSIILPVKSMESTSGTGLVTSETDHFTDIINGTITVPEQPDPLLYNPNTIKDIKVGNPAEEINVLDPPILNNKGDAILNYPIEIPRGRNGMQPSVSLVYNSSNENGWLGVGWDIPIKAVIIDTRLGVPRYNGNEKYLLEGEQVVAIGNGFFQLRKEGAFNRIIRHGNSCNNYSWEVIDKNGTRYFYGTNSDSRLKNYRNPDGTIGSNGNIYMWCLERILDTNGNTILYSYNHDKEITGSVGEPYTQIYLQKITYTGSGSAEGPFSIEFNRDLDDDQNLRKDVVSDCRGGFQTYMHHLLKSIDVKLNNTIIRKYLLTYKTGQFNKTLLKKIDQYGEGGVISPTNLFNTHDIEYYDEVGIEGDNNKLNGFDSNIYEYVNSNTPYLNYTTEISGDLNSFVGITEKILPLMTPEKQNSIGFVLGIDLKDSEQKSMLVDIDGDGLLDIVFMQGVNIYYKSNLGFVNNSYRFSNSKRIAFLTYRISNLGKENSSSLSSGVQLNLNGYTFSAEKSNGIIMDSLYFSDINGDGLVDIVSIKSNISNIYYNHGVDNDGNLIFSDAAPDGFNSGQNSGEIPDFNFENKTREELVNTYHRDDPILMWKAPYSGNIRVTGDIHLIPKLSLKGGNDQYRTDDGVQVSIQVNNTLLWSAIIPSGNTSEFTPVGVDSITIQAGDQVYFRVNSIDDGSFDVVAWDPIIEYINVDLDIVDENQLPLYRYEAKSDFSFVGTNTESSSLMDGTVKIEGKLLKEGITSDDVELRFEKEDFSGNRTDIYSYTVPGSFIGEINIDSLTNIDVSSSEKLICRLSSDTQIDWSKISINPVVTYTSIDGIDTITDENGNPLYYFNLQPDICYFPIKDSEPVYPYIIPEDKSGQVRVIYSIQKFPDILDMPDDYTANITLAVKKNGMLLKKQKGIIQKIGADQVLLDYTFDVVPGDKLFFVCTSDKNDFTTYTQVGSPQLYFEDDNGNDQGTIGTNNGYEAVGIVYKSGQIDHPFAGGYRSWYYGRWNGELDVLDPKKMVSPDLHNVPDFGTIDESNFENVGNSIHEQLKTFSPMTPHCLDVITAMVIEQIWSGIDKDCWIGKVHDPSDLSNTIFALSSSRVIKKYIPKDIDNQENNFIARGIPRISTVTNNPYNFSGPGGSSYDVSIMNAVGENITKMDFFDLNGDSFPDIITKNGVRYTNPDGSMDEQYMPFDFSEIREYVSCTYNYNNTSYDSPKPPRHAWSYFVYPTVPNSDDIKYLKERDSFGTIVNVNAWGSATAVKDMIDVNGDKLPDMVYVKVGADGRKSTVVRLNLGYVFGNEEKWDDAETIRLIKTGSFSYSLGGSTVRDKGSEGASIAYGVSISRTAVDYIDINGDNLPDKIEKGYGGDVIDFDAKPFKLFVRFNTGKGFTENKYEWSGSNEALALSSNLNGNFNMSNYMSKYYSIPIFPAYSLIFNPGSSARVNQGGNTVRIIDINGDGLNDHVIGETNDIKVYKNKTGKTNLIKKVLRPMGSSFEIDYKLEGNTKDMPKPKWVVSKISMTDGMKNIDQDNGYHELTMQYEYAGGYFDRNEKLFYGFSRIKEIKGDGSYSVYLFYNKDYYTKGLRKKLLISDKDDKLFVANISDYAIRNITELIKFPYVEKQSVYYYEGNAIINTTDLDSDPVGAAKVTAQTFSYDDFGNIIHYNDNGDEGNNDDVAATISYKYDMNSYIIGKPNYIIVSDGDGNELRKRNCTYDSKGNLTLLRQINNDGSISSTNIYYYDNGNVLSIAGPENNKGQRYGKTYTYDSISNSQLTKITDSHGYSSKIIYDTQNLFYGKPATVVDVNGNSTYCQYDKFGRIITIRGPYDQTGDPTISIDYNTGMIPAYAKATNKGYIDNETGTEAPIVIYTYSDGLGRVIQTKKSAEVGNSSCMVSSGKIEFDILGRIRRLGQPVISSGGNGYAASEMRNPVIYSYDILNRPALIEYPSIGNVHYSYYLEDNSFLTHIVDQQNNEKKISYDIRDNIISIKEHLKNPTDKWITTKYSYNPLQEITGVVDDNGNKTEIHYDNIGRRISINNPDSGLIEYKYDFAGNMIEKITPNLRSNNKSIKYIYNYDELSTIDYPDSNDINYIYGNSTDGGNTRGRIKTILTGKMREYREYGLLGELVKSTKYIQTTIPIQSEKRFITEYVFDTMGRMRRLIFPDGENIIYGYDSGGLLRCVKGKRGESSNYYVKNISYDKYGNRTSIESGNGVVTKYSHNDITSRLEILNTIKGNITLQDINYHYDSIGNITNLNCLGVDINNKYDELYRLIKSEGSYKKDQNTTYTYENDFIYDSIGNLSNKIQNCVTPLPNMTYTYNYVYGSTKPHAVTSTGEKNYTYDLNGNMISSSLVSDANVRMNFTWNEENRLIQTWDGLNITEYTYDDLGTRILKKGNNGEIIYVSNNLSERNGDVTSKHIFAGNTRVATKIISDKCGENIYYYHSDHLGSSSVVTTNDGSINEKLQYMPYGETWIHEKGTENTESMPYKFTSKEQDQETGLYYFGARYYEPRLSRWISSDPAVDMYIPTSVEESYELPGYGGVFNPVNVNLYHYAGNNPINIIDPDGNDIILLYAPNGGPPIPSKGGSHAGHTAGLIKIQNGNHKDEWMYYSKNGITPDGKMPENIIIEYLVSDGDIRHIDHIQFFKSPQDFFKNMSKQVQNFKRGNRTKQCVEYVDKNGNPRYTDSLRIKTTPLEDVNIGFKLNQQINKPYNLKRRNCNDPWDDAIDEYLPNSNKILPNNWFLDMKNIYNNNPERLRDNDMADDVRAR